MILFFRPLLYVYDYVHTLSALCFGHSMLSNKKNQTYVHNWRIITILNEANFFIFQHEKYYLLTTAVR
jgi:hypothetical protein